MLATAVPTLTPVPKTETPVSKTDWYRELGTYEKPDLGRAIWQLVDTLVPFLGLWVLMAYMLQHQVSYALVFPLVVVAAALQIRIFIFFHDCTHGSFFASRRANQILGYVTGIICYTPYDEWRHTHAVHHATAGDLDRRGLGDIETLTVQEYRQASSWKQFTYRLTRNPAFLLAIGAPLLFIVLHRLPRAGAGRREALSVWYTDAAMAVVIVFLSWTIGLGPFLLIQLPMAIIAAAGGVWFFYVQHQFDGVYWARHENWDYFKAALEGSSYYKLPLVLQWISGNIGFHHIHHLKPRIANYHLPQCYENIPALQTVKPLTLRTSLKSLSLNLWDEENQRMVGFKEARG
ncbi:MAG: fatty acid desaturase [Anaerolineae bacterium]